MVGRECEWLCDTAVPSLGRLPRVLGSTSWEERSRSVPSTSRASSLEAMLTSEQLVLHVHTCINVHVYVTVSEQISHIEIVVPCCSTLFTLRNGEVRIAIAYTVLD